MTSTLHRWLRPINRLTLLFCFFFVACLSGRVALAQPASEPPPTLVWRTELFDKSASNGKMVLDQTGLPHIAYGGSDQVLYMHWTGSQWLTSTVMNIPSIDIEIGAAHLTLDRHSYPHVLSTSCNPFNCTWHYVQWDGAQWRTEQLPVGNSSPFHNGLAVYTMALDTADQAHITYWESTPLDDSPFDRIDQQYAYQSPTGWVTATVQSNIGTVTYDSSTLRLDQTGAPHLIYAAKPSLLLYATLSAQGWYTKVVATDAGLSKLALGPDQQPHIIYLEHKEKELVVKYARQTDQQWIVQTVDTVANSAYREPQLAIAVDSKGYPHLVYRSQEGVRYAYWTGSRWLIYRLLIPTETGGDLTSLALALDPTNLPRILYTHNYRRKAAEMKLLWAEAPQQQLYLPLIRE